MIRVELGPPKRTAVAPDCWIYSMVMISDGFRITTVLKEFPLKLITDELLIVLLFFLINTVLRTPVVVVSCPETNTESVDDVGLCKTPLEYKNDGDPLEFEESCILKSRCVTIESSIDLLDDKKYEAEGRGPTTAEGPVGPIEPVEPVAPVIPFIPAAPVGPVPIGPVAPVLPRNPVGPLTYSN